MANSGKALAAQFMQFINKVTYLEKNKVFPYKDIKLYPSEMHLMMLIDDGHHSNITEMANILGVTKGAVSQTISRLVKKGVLQVTKDPYQKNELTAEFTPFGIKAMGRYRSLRSFLLTQYADYLHTLNAGERKTINNFIIRAGEILDDFQD